MLALLALSCAQAYAQGQNPPAKRLSLDEAVRTALANYPAVRAALEQVAAARSGVGLARASYLPRADMIWQSDAATRNNIFGLLLPQSIIPSVTGPVLATASMHPAVESLAGVGAAWEPFDFGYRRAIVNAARAGESRSNSELALTRLDVAVAAARAYLEVAAAARRVDAARADVARREIFARSVHALVQSELRPGVDASRADAELAAARTREIEAETAEVEARAVLAVILGAPGAELDINTTGLLSLPPAETMSGPQVEAHPLAKIDQARVDETRARIRALDRAYVPHFNLQSILSGRGSSANVDGTFSGAGSGFAMQRANWAAGLTVTFAALDFASLRSRRQIEEANARSEQARLEQTTQALTGEIQKARAALDGARRVAENTPVQLHAAQDTESQARARFDAGLATAVDVADAQRLLVEADVQNSIAQLNVWAGLLNLHAASGDLEPFLQLVRTKTQGGP